ncbi:MAG: hypothetical protein LBM38_01510 [Clostridiales bacterium]|jgi:hypothetical protein|nr:hypothetical protein [Clostridiales bacterium]
MRKNTTDFVPIIEEFGRRITDSNDALFKDTVVIKLFTTAKENNIPMDNKYLDEAIDNLYNYDFKSLDYNYINYFIYRLNQAIILKDDPKFNNLCEHFGVSYVNDLVDNINKLSRKQQFFLMSSCYYYSGENDFSHIDISNLDIITKAYFARLPSNNIEKRLDALKSVFDWFGGEYKNVAQFYLGREALLTFARLPGSDNYEQTKALEAIIDEMGKDYTQVAQTNFGRKVLITLGNITTLTKPNRLKILQAVFDSLGGEFKKVARTDLGREALLSLARIPLADCSNPIKALKAVYNSLDGLEKNKRMLLQIRTIALNIYEHGQNIYYSEKKVLQDIITKTEALQVDFGNSDVIKPSVAQALTAPQKAVKVKSITNSKRVAR